MEFWIILGTAHKLARAVGSSPREAMRVLVVALNAYGREDG